MGHNVRGRHQGYVLVSEEIGSCTVSSNLGALIVHIRTNAPARRQFKHLCRALSLHATPLDEYGSRWQLAGELVDGECPSLDEAIDRMEASGTLVSWEYIVSVKVGGAGQGAGGGEGWRPKRAPLPRPADEDACEGLLRYEREQGKGYVPGRKLLPGEGASASLPSD